MDGWRMIPLWPQVLEEAAFVTGGKDEVSMRLGSGYGRKDLKGIKECEREQK